MTILLTLIATAGISSRARAQFSDQNPALPALERGSAEWGDYDGDNDLDLVVTGRDNSSLKVARIYRNDGGNFTDIGAGLPGVEQSSVSWADYDRDGDLDLLISGLDATATPIARIYRNDSGSFVNIGAGLLGVSKSAGAWADFDNDGDLDLLLTGLAATNQPVTRLYRNTGGVFADAGAALTNVSQGAVAWADYDSDGRVDLLLTGRTSGGASFSRLYRNVSGTFVDSGASLTNVQDSAVAWIDADNNGTLDFVLTGRDGNTVTEFYQGNGSGGFTPFTLPSTSLASASVSWGDYDADGDADLLIAGEDNSFQPQTILYRNDGAPNFSTTAFGLDNVRNASARWGDYDLDGRLDALLIGATNGGGPVAHLYRNQSPQANSAPSSPGNLQASINGTMIGFSWNSGTPGFSTNLRIGTTPNGNDIVPGMADASNGYRRVVRLGNMGKNAFWATPVAGMPLTIYWSVQNIDAAFTGSQFAPTQTFTYSQSTTALTSNPNPSLTGQFTTLTATVTPATATGSVTFKDGGTVLGSAVLGGGTATFNTSSLAPGSHSLTAVYVGDGTTIGSTSPIATHSVVDPTSIFVVSNLNPSAFGQSVTFTATVTPAAATGTVNFTDSGTTIGTGTLSGGVSTFSTSGLTLGTHQIRAVYVGSVSYAGSTSSPLDQVILQATATALTSNPNPSNLNQTVTLTATVTPLPGSGTVTFRDGATVIGTSSQSGGVFTRTTSTLTAGSHSLTATYNGNASFATSTSPISPHTVRQPTTTSIASSLNPSESGQSVTFTATVTPAAATGTVDFTDGGTLVGSGTLSGGIATFATASLSVGNHPIRATYQGDATYGTSQSSNVTQSVMLPTTTALSSAPNPSALNQSVTLTATVSPPGATGTVTFKDGASTIGSNAIGGGIATRVVSNLTAGFHALTAVYAGNTTYAPSTSPTVNHSVLLLTTTMLTSTPNPSALGQNVAVTVTVSQATATGNVTFFDGVTTLSTQPLASGQATLNITTLANGTHSLTAVYGGDATYAGSTSPPVDQHVVVFTDIGAGLPGLNHGDAAWGDFDGDGDLDLFKSSTTGSSPSELYRNDAGVFTNTNEVFPHLSNHPGVAWGDFDNDGDLDLLLTGLDIGGVPISAVYRNDAGTFVDIGAGLRNVWDSTAAWGDFDNDGDLDILLTGNEAPFASPALLSTVVYRNNGGVFTDIVAGLPGVRSGSAAWGDFDGDGDLDVVLAGRAAVGAVAAIYRNEASGFIDIAAGLPAVTQSSVAWGDYDNDGDLDLALSGSLSPGSTDFAAIFRNEAGTFVNISAGLSGTSYGSLAWGDFDNDGDLDLAQTGSSSFTAVYKNDNGTFVPIESGLPNAGNSTVAWGDFDNDGDLDIFLSGFPGDFARIYRNHLDIPNTPPSPPVALAAQFVGNAATFSWNAATDAQTPAAGLTYNLRVGTTPGGSEISSAMAHSVNGYRRVPKLGNTNHGLSWTLTLPPAPQYYWSVQAVDAAFAGSAFAAEQAFAMPPSFTDTEAGFPAVYAAASAWGDYDNDGDLDFILTGYNGSGFSRLYRNDAGTFIDSAINLPGVYAGSVAWGDCDNDGDLDLFLAGISNSGRISRVYLNEAGSFVDSNAGLPGVGASSAAWGDYDNDGDLDLLLSGGTGSAGVCSIFRNDAGSFVDMGAMLPGIAGSTVAWGDYDNDGDLDLVLIGLSGTTPLSRIYRNDNGSFVNIGALLSNVSSGSAAWGDYDNDGDLDLFTTGYTNGTGSSHLYRNDDGVFSDTGMTFPSVYGGSAAWGDYDNDGDLDLLFTGGDSSTIVGVCRLYRNDHGSLVDSGAALPGVYNGSIGLWADYDNDGDLDCLLGGLANSGSSAFVRIYRNNATTSNSTPAAPAGLSAQLNGDSATFSWNPSTDAQTPAATLTYNLRVGTTPGGSEISSAMASGFNGYRRVPQLGNVNHRLSWTLTLPPALQYYWSVQAVDAAFAGSAFAAEKTINNQFGDISAGLPGAGFGSVAWGDYDNDGDLDVLLTGSASSGQISRVYRNDGGNFVDVGAALAAVYLSSVAWGDFDNDGDLDILLSGASGQTPTTIVYRNDGGDFVNIGAALPGIRNGSVAWGDYDNDGDLDILLAGLNQTAGFVAISRVYRNDSGNFVDSGASLPGVYNCSVAWGDYDNDGDLDVLLAGLFGPGAISRLYRNDGGGFVDSGIALPGVTNASVAWGDYDNDGDLDFLLTGYTGQGQTNLSRIYRNDSGSFVNSGSVLPDVTLGSVAWGDCDNDGDLDILLTGSATSTSGYTSGVYKNDGGNFVDSGLALPGVNGSSVAWGDYDNDGDLDFLLTGFSDSGQISRIYRNNTITPNTIPTAPTNLSAQIIGQTATFSWNAATDAQTPSLGLTYNLRIGTTPGGNEISSGMADVTTGFRRVPRMGNVGHRLSWPIRLNQWPNGGHFYWSVQAVDAAFAGSPWAAGDVSAVEVRPEPPAALALHAGTPNPFRQVTRVSFDLPSEDRVRLKVYDVHGRLVRALRDEVLATGRYESVWDGTDGTGRRAGAGIYFIGMEVGAFKESRRVVLLR